jgi:excinuclease UvrABC helicase subunit UvrB
MPSFKVHSDFQRAGDQPSAIASLAEGVGRGDRFQARVADDDSARPELAS